MKTMSAAFRATASGDSNAPLEIYDLYLDSTVLHIVNYDKNIAFFDLEGNSATYIAIPVTRETYERSSENSVNTINLAIANIDRSMSAYLANTEFRGRRITIRKIFADQLTSSGDVAIVFDGVMDTPAASEESVQVTAVDRIGTLRKEAPRRWYQLMCNNKFSDEACFYGRTSGDMYATLNGTFSSGCTTQVLKSAALSQANNYWKNGDITITSGLNGVVKRKNVSSDPLTTSINVDIALSYAPVSGDTFTVRRTCDKTHFSCSGDFNNDANWGGFDTIPQSLVIR